MVFFLKSESPLAPFPLFLGNLSRMFTAFESPIMAVAQFQISGDRVVELMKLAIALRCACPNGIARNDTNC